MLISLILLLEETREANLGNQDVDKYVLNIMSDMLTKSQMHKNDDHICENFEVDTLIANHGVVINHDHAVEDVETLCEDVIIKDESLLLINSKEYKLFTKGTQSINDTTPCNHKDFDLIGHVVEFVIGDN